MTTALVVESPTPLAPPDVVNPQEQLTCRHRAFEQCCQAASIVRMPIKAYKEHNWDTTLASS